MCMSLDYGHIYPTAKYHFSQLQKLTKHLRIQHMAAKTLLMAFWLCIPLQSSLPPVADFAAFLTNLCF